MAVNTRQYKTTGAFRPYGKIKITLPRYLKRGREYGNLFAKLMRGCSEDELGDSILNKVNEILEGSAERTYSSPLIMNVMRWVG